MLADPSPPRPASACHKSWGAAQTAQVSGIGRRLSKSALWIGGAQWAGKTTVARILSERHGLGHLARG
jgi:hypothetical protein